MPNYRKKHSKQIKISKSMSSSSVRKNFGDISAAKISGYLKRSKDRYAAARTASEKYAEFARNSRAKENLRDASDPKPVSERIADKYNKTLKFLKNHKKPKDKRAARHINPKYLLLILGVLLIGLIIASGASETVRKPFKDIASIFVVPAQKGINSIGLWFSELITSGKSMQELQEENRQLRAQVDDMNLELTLLRQNESEIERLNALLNLKDRYSDRKMIGAHIIAKGPSKWFSTFTIDVGTNNGVYKDMNVIASGGLVGIVTDAGKNFSTVRSIIDDESSVSAQFESTSELCLINGSLTLMEDNILEFTNVDGDVFITPNEAVVTSHVSSKYLPGLLIGYVYDFQPDANDLTQSGHIKPVVDFSSLEEVLVILELKETSD